MDRQGTLAANACPEDKIPIPPDVHTTDVLTNDLEGVGSMCVRRGSLKPGNRKDALNSPWEGDNIHEHEGDDLISFSVTPGAFRAEPGHGLMPAFEEDLNHPPSEDLESQGVYPQFQVIDSPQNEMIVVDAALVHPNRATSRGGGLRRRKVVRAEPYRPVSRRLWLAFLASLVLVSGLAIGVGLGLARRTTTSNYPLPESPSPAPTLGAIQSEWVQQANLFPSTLKAIVAPDSAQAQALTWVTENALEETVSAGSNLTLERGKQRFALASLYYALNGPSSLLSDTWLSHGLHECNWTGVECSSEVVRALRLSGSQRIQGYMAPEIGLLTALTSLSVDHMMALTRGIPTEIGYSLHLTSLDLNANGLTGRIPIELGRLQMLVYLDLSKNRLSGTIPTEIGSVSSLQSIRLYENALVGPLPSVSGMTSLRTLNLAHNQLVGTISTDIGDVAHLEQFHLSTNRFTGPIPAALGNLRNLTFLSLRDNPLTGTVASELGRLSKLASLRIDKAKLTGTVPTELFGLRMLRDLRLSENQLSGPIPSHVGNLTSARSLRIDGNRFTGGIPTAWSGMSDLRELLMNDNDLTGRIPSELATLSSLEVLHLQHNRNLTGSIPTELCQLAIVNGMNLTVDCESLDFNESSCPCLCAVDLSSGP